VEKCAVKDKEVNHMCKDTVGYIPSLADTHPNMLVGDTHGVHQSIN
jgi:hypothetical protein